MLDILAIAAHPDDAELGCAGTLIHYANKGYKTGILDLTQGEKGTRGTIAVREKEAKASSKVLNLKVRKNLKLPDGFINYLDEDKRKLICQIRQLRPKIILCNAEEDRHPDHGNSAILVEQACFLSRLPKVVVKDEKKQELPFFAPSLILHYIQDRWIKPDIVFDITKEWETKKEAIACFKSQFYQQNSQEDETYISKPSFLNSIEARARELGKTIGVELAEGFTCRKFLGVKDIFQLL